MNHAYQNHVNNVNSGYQYPYYNSSHISNNNERLAGGFVFPFLLGGVTGAALAPAFYNNNYNRPVYYYQPYPYYYPYPRRWF